MKPTHALFGVLLSATLAISTHPALAHERDYPSSGQLVLSFGSSPLVWLSELGLYVALGTRQPVFFHDNYYYIYDDKRWHRSRHARGPWKRIKKKRLPGHLRNYRRGDWTHYQNRANKRYRRDGRYRRPVPALRQEQWWHLPDDTSGYRRNRNAPRDLYRVPQPHRVEPRHYREQRRPNYDNRDYRQPDRREQRREARRDQRPNVDANPNRRDRHSAPPPARELKPIERRQERQRTPEQRRDNRRNAIEQGRTGRGSNSGGGSNPPSGWWNQPD